MCSFVGTEDSDLTMRVSTAEHMRSAYEGCHFMPFQSESLLRKPGIQQVLGSNYLLNSSVIPTLGSGARYY